MEPTVLDVTEQRLNETRGVSNWSGNNVTSWTRKSARAALTKTEQGMLDVVGAGLDIGFWSNALVYSPALKRFTKLERKALLSLLARGALAVYREYNPDREIIRKAA